MKVLLIQKKKRKRKGFYEGFNSLKNRTQCTMFPLLQSLGEMIGLQSYPQISFLGRLISRLEPMICCFWWKALAIAARPNLSGFNFLVRKIFPLQKNTENCILLYV